MISSQALVTDGSGGFSVGCVDVSDPGPGEVLVKLQASGVCHTDADMARSATDVFVLGHEGAGIVGAVGEGVDGLDVGQPVLLTWAIACGRCAQCRRGHKVLCTGLGAGPAGHAHPGATTRRGAPLRRSFNLGTMSSHTVVRREAVVPLLPGIQPVPACLLGCGVMTGWGSVTNVARVKAGESVVVLGVGGVGLNVLQGAALAGASPIVAVDADPRRLDMCPDFGATHVVLAEREDLTMAAVARQVRTLTGGEGADHCFECTAVPALAVAPLRLVRNGGTAVAVSGVEEDVVADMRLFEWDKVYINPLYGGCDPEVDFATLQRLYLEGRLKLDELVGATYPLEKAAEAFADLASGRPGRGVLVMG